MKPILSLLLLLCFTANAQTRSDVKIYGYVQPVIGGASPIEAPNETGVESSSASERQNYYIYMTAPAGTKVYPLEIWMEGVQYSTKTTMVKSTPVVLTVHTGETDPKKITLVPKTSSQVLLITLSSVRPSKVLAIAADKAEENDIVISYKMGGKFYYASLKKLTPVEAAAMQ